MRLSSLSFVTPRRTGTHFVQTHLHPTMHQLTACTAQRSISGMARVALFLVVLLGVLTFNAYACILPVPQPPEMDCASGTAEPVRGTCDVFLELGPQSLSAPSHAIPPVHLAWTWPVPPLPAVSTPLIHLTDFPPRADPSIHCSISTTVLRI